MVCFSRFLSRCFMEEWNVLVVFSLKQTMENITVPRNYIPFSKPKGNESWPSKNNTACNEKFHGGPKDGANVGFAIPGSSRYAKILPCGRFFVVKRHKFYTLGRSRYVPFLVAEQNNTYMSFFSSSSRKWAAREYNDLFNLHPPCTKICPKQVPSKVVYRTSSWWFHIYFWNFNPECLGKNSNPISTYTFLFQLPNRPPKTNTNSHLPKNFPTPQTFSNMIMKSFGGLTLAVASQPHL